MSTGVGPAITYLAFPFISLQVWSETRICLWCGKSPETVWVISPQFLDGVTQGSGL